MDISPLFVPLTLLAGGLLAVQVGANAQLSRATGSPLAASAMQLAVGLVVLTTAAAAAGALGVLDPLPHVQWWQWFGGLASRRPAARLRPVRPVRAHAPAPPGGDPSSPGRRRAPTPRRRAHPDLVNLVRCRGI